ncbi:calmodulin-binding transcription activator 2-like isoform X1 [Ciona intestinalis]
MKADVVIPEELQQKLPPPALNLPKHKYTWMSNEEIASILINFKQLPDWLTTSRVFRPESGCLLMFNRKKVKYRQDLYIWKTKRKSKWCREDHVKLKVAGIPCITALYVHSDVLPTFHRRCYWFIQNPDIVLVHYLNYPYNDDGKQIIRDFSLNHQCQQWRQLSKQELLDQLRPMFTRIPWPSVNGPQLVSEAMDIIIESLIEKHYAEQRSIQIPNRYTPVTIKPNIILSNGSNIPCIELMRAPCTTSPPSVSCIVNNGHNTIINTENTKHNQTAVSNTILCNGNSVIFVNDASGRKCAVVQAVSTINTMSSQTIPCPLSKIASKADTGYQMVNSTPQTEQYIERNSIHQTAEISPSTSIKVDGKISDEGDKSLNANTGLKLPSEDHYSLLPASSSHGINVNSRPTSKMIMIPNLSSTPGCLKDDKSHLPLSEELKCNGYIQGIKDVMVPNCHSNLLQPKRSPFVESSESDAFSDVGFDVFDVDSLFNTSTSVASTSMETVSDQTNSSNESAVSDLFPQQLWDPVLDENSSVRSYGDESALPGTSHSSEMQNLSLITEYSPDWSYSEGGVKVLITGSWNFCNNYTCMFGSISVPATNIQNGVLRCYCPAHDVGHVDLTVVCNDRIVSKPVPFQYKQVPPAYSELATQWLKLDENEFKLSIINRLERMEQRLNLIGENGNLINKPNTLHGGVQHGLKVLNLDVNADQPPRDVNNEESRLITLCQRLYHWFAMFDKSNFVNLDNEVDGSGLTILHCAAALGYQQLIHALRSLNEMSGNFNAFLEIECNPQNVDKYGCSALMWACASGHQGCAEILYTWRKYEIHTLDYLGRCASAIAQLHGHHELFKRLEVLSMCVQQNDDFYPEDDEVDTSSIGDTTISSSGDTLDSGEDSMETDDTDIQPTTSRPPSPSNQRSFKFTTRNTTGDQMLNNQSTDFTSELARNGNLFADSGTTDIATLAEQILESSPEVMKETAEGLTLRSLPHFVTSRCGGKTSIPYDYQRDNSTINWCDFLQLPPRSTSIRTYQNPNELELDSLRLSEQEQRQLYFAAKAVLSAYHTERLSLNGQELRASLLIQRCYRKYRMFAMCKKMNEAAVLIQSKFRSYQEQKRFQKSRHAAILIQSFYRSYKHARTYRGQRTPRPPSVRLIEDALRGHLTKRRQHQAARKIQRFLRRCHCRLRQQDLSQARNISSCMNGLYTC